MTKTTEETVLSMLNGRQDIEAALRIKERYDAGLILSDEHCYRFYYCESQDEYLLGMRVDNFFYAHWQPKFGWVWDMSRYLPWGQTIHDESSAWKVHTYPSEPVEIGTCEWFTGFLKMVEKKDKEVS